MANRKRAFREPPPRAGIGVLLAIVVAVAGAPVGWAQAADLPGELERTLAQPGWRQGERKAGIAEFYLARRYAPIWRSERGLTRAGAALLKALAAADEDGLAPARYLPAGRAGAAAEELRLSLALLTFVSDLRLGAVRPGVRYVSLARQTIDETPAAILRRVADAGDIAKTLAGYAPHHPGYGRLRAALARYRAIAKAGGWAVILSGPDIVKSTGDPRIGPLRRRLVLTGDLARDAATGADYDATLKAALRRFQDRHNLPPTEKLTAQSRAALNLSVARRIATIRVNMERLRWMPDAVPKRGVVVNAAAFELDVLENGRRQLTTRVIVGKCYQRTPQFVTMMTGVQFNPYWNVPRSITRNEIMPRVRRDPGYLARQQMRIVVGGKALAPSQVDWSKMQGVPFQIRQQPGAHNALGRLRFLMPNPFNVYLHDTPSKRLFERRQRTFSHGCIRVQNPGTLAAYLLRGTAGWDAAAVKRAMTVTVQRTVPFANPLPVYVGYFTAWAMPDGQVQFRDDVYQRDLRVIRALDARR